MASLIHYLALGLPLGAAEKEIRQRYLQLVRRHPPGKEPERFQQITAAYEALKDERARVGTAVLGTARYGDFELALEALIHARPTHRKMPGLKDLLAAEGISDG